MEKSTLAHIGNRPPRQRGLSLVEIMVGLMLGMLITIAILASVSTMNKQRKTSVGGAEAQTNAQAALNLIETAARQAGAGLFYNGQLLCQSINIYYNGATLSDGATLVPVWIADGGATGSDAISFIYANAPGGSSTSAVVDDMPTASSNFVVNNQGSLQIGDLAVIGVPGSSRPCTLFKVTAFPPGGGSCGGVTSSCIDIQHNPGANGEYNPPNPATAFTDAPRYGYNNTPPVIGPAIITRAGDLRNETFEVLCNSLVTSDATSGAPSCVQSPLAFTNAVPQVGNIVMIQAQYGITATSDSDVVTSWVDATGTWAAPTAAQVPRIKAIRVAVVARSSELDRTNVTSSCTNDAGVANTGPCSFQDAAAPVIDLSAMPVPAGASWQRYRYRVYTSVIPLRNVAWNY